MHDKLRHSRLCLADDDGRAEELTQHGDHGDMDEDTDGSDARNEYVPTD